MNPPWLDKERSVQSLQCAQRVQRDASWTIRDANIGFSKFKASATHHIHPEISRSRVALVTEYLHGVLFVKVRNKNLAALHVFALVASTGRDASPHAERDRTL
jgi:hypothetical protein